MRQLLYNLALITWFIVKYFDYIINYALTHDGAVLCGDAVRSGHGIGPAVPAADQPGDG